MFDDIVKRFLHDVVHGHTYRCGQTFHLGHMTLNVDSLLPLDGIDDLENQLVELGAQQSFRMQLEQQRSHFCQCAPREQMQLLEAGRHFVRTFVP